MYKNEDSDRVGKICLDPCTFLLSPLVWNIWSEFRMHSVSEAWNKMNQPTMNSELALRMNESYLLSSLLSEAEEHLMRPSQ